jgi:hypothetical protein
VDLPLKTQSLRSLHNIHEISRTMVSKPRLAVLATRLRTAQPPFVKPIYTARHQTMQASATQETMPNLPAVDAPYKKVMDCLHFLHAKRARAAALQLVTLETVGGPAPL